jgi:3-isopropylmalate dehydrogenase
MRRREYAIACLSTDGIGPEVMAEAVRAVRAVARLHGFSVDDRHVPFGSAAVQCFGHPLPASTREACRNAAAVLVAATREPALEVVKAELDLTWRMTRVVTEAPGDVVVVSALRDESEAFAVDRAFSLARSRRASVSAVAGDARFRAVVDRVAVRHPGVTVEHFLPEAVLPVLARTTAPFDVLVTERVLAEELSAIAAHAGDGMRIVASGRLAENGPGIFGPTHGSVSDIAGQGVANPSAMVLAAALMLGECLGERTAARTLERGIVGTLRGGTRTPDMVESGRAATTREFMDVLLAQLGTARADTEFAGATA